MYPRIAFFTTSLQTDVQRLQSRCLEHFFPDTARRLVDGSSGWPQRWFEWLDRAAAEIHNFDWFIHIDEDCFLMDETSLLQLLEDMTKRGEDIAGPSDAGHHYRDYNPAALNPFFMVCNRRVIQVWQQRTSVPRFDPRWLEGIDFYPVERLVEWAFDRSVDPFSWKAFVNEPYYAFFWVLKSAGIKFRYLPVGFEKDLAVSTLLSANVWHAWYLRERHSDSILSELHTLSNRVRYDRIIERVEARLTRRQGGQG